MWFHISKAIKGDVEALKDLSRITGRKVNNLKDAFVSINGEREIGEISNDISSVLLKKSKIH